MIAWVSENWADLVALLAAIGTLALAALAYGQLRSLKEQVKQGQQQVEHAEVTAAAAKSSADSAQAAVRESWRARGDESAHTLVVAAEEPYWPPFLHTTRRTSASGDGFNKGDPRLLDDPGLSRTVGPGERFWFPQHENQLLWFTINVVIMNEGRTSARLTVSGEVRPSPTPGMSLGSPVDVLPQVEVLQTWPQYLLRPGKAAAFTWGAGLLLREWTAEPVKPCRLQINARSLTEHHIVDEVVVEFGARPLVPVPRAEGQWELADSLAGRSGITVYPTERRFLGEG